MDSVSIIILYILDRIRKRLPYLSAYLHMYNYVNSVAFRFAR